MTNKNKNNENGVKKLVTEKQQEKRFVWICIAPALILFTIFMVLPTLNIFRMSLYKWGGLSAKKTFVGFNNFKILLQDQKFLQAFQNQILLIVVVAVVTMVLAILFAAILVREDIKGKNFFRIVFYIPNILSVAVISAIFSAIYDPATGLLNSLIALFKPENWTSIKFLGDQSIVIYAIAGTMIWQAIGYYMVMYMSSMSSIPEHLYEAASLEGVGKVKQFFTITLPLVWNNIRSTLTFFIISTINMSFLFVQVMTNGGPDGASQVFLNYLYNQAYNNSSYGYAMAIGVVIFIFSFALAAIVNAITKRDTLEY